MDETDIAARVAGLNAIGAAVDRTPDGSIAQMFDSRAVPDLRQVAWNESSLNVRIRAVFALRRAGTPAAQAALAVLSTSSCPQVAAAASQAMHPPH